MSSRACGGGVSGRPAARPRRLAAATTPSWSSSRPTSEPLSTAMPARLTTARVTATSAPRPGGAVRRRDAAGRDRPGAGRRAGPGLRPRGAPPRMARPDRGRRALPGGRRRRRLRGGPHHRLVGAGDPGRGVAAGSAGQAAHRKPPGPARPGRPFRRPERPGLPHARRRRPRRYHRDQRRRDHHLDPRRGPEGEAGRGDHHPQGGIGRQGRPRRRRHGLGPHRPVRLGRQRHGDGQQHHQGAGPMSSRRRGRLGRRFAAGALAVVAVGGGVGAYPLTSADDAPTTQSLATTQAVRRTLTQTVDASFTLVDSDARKLQAPSGGTVTSVSLSEGKAVKALTALVTIDGKSIYGIPSSYPLYRNLAEGDEGQDVQALQQALAGAGYDPGDVDGEFGSGTVEALSDWQADHDLDETGRLDLASFVSYQPGSIVQEVSVEVGDRVPAGGQLASLSKDGLAAQADVSQLDLGDLKLGQEVDLTFDRLSTAKGTVDEIAISGSGSNTSVRVVSGTGTVTRPVVVGLVTTEGTEVLTGVKAGEEVVTGVTASDTGSAGQTQQQGGGFPGGGLPGGGFGGAGAGARIGGGGNP